MLHKATLNYTLLLCCFWRNQGGVKSHFASASCFLHPPRLLFSSGCCLWLFACKSRFDFPSSVGMYLRNFRSSFLVKQLSMCLEEQRGTRCRVALSFSALVLWCVGIAQHILQYKISHVVMTAMCTSGKRFHKPKQQITATWLRNTTVF